MSPITTLIFVFTCLAANCILIDGKCEVLQRHDRFNYNDIAGKWILGSGPRILLRVFENIVVTVMSGPGKDELTVNGNATLLRRLTPNFHIPVSLQFLLTFPEKNSSLVEAHARPPFTIFNGRYNIVSLDPICHIIAQGCTPFNLKPIISVLFRQKEPTEQCVEETKAAFEEAGLDYSTIVPDSTSSLNWWKF